MLPLLKRLGSGGEHKFSELVDELGSNFALTKEELSELLPSGTQRIFSNRVGWARLYLRKAGLLDSPKRGFLQITERGRDILSQGPERIDTKFLERFPEFVAFKEGSAGTDTERERWRRRRLFHHLARPLRSWRMPTVKFGLRSPMKFWRRFRKSIRSNSSKSLSTFLG